MVSSSNNDETRTSGRGPRVAAHKGAVVAAATAGARVSLVPALTAATVGVAAMLLARAVLGLATPAELFGDRLTVLIPLDVFSAFLSVLGHDAKYLFYVGLVIAQGVATALGIAVYWGIRCAWAARARDLNQSQPASPSAPLDTDILAQVAPGPADIIAIPLVFWLVSAGLVAPAIGGGVFGSGLVGGVAGVVLAEVVPAVVTSASFVPLLRRALEAARGDPNEVARPARRRALRQLGIGIVAVAAGAAAWRFIASGIAGLGLPSFGSGRPALDTGTVPDSVSPPPVPTYGPWATVAGQTSELTPTARFYYVSKNLAGDPVVDGQKWRLSIGGLVNRPMTLSLDDLRAMPAVLQDRTLECISNDVGGDLISTAHWTGVRLADLLKTAGIKVGASELVFHCADGYSDSLHLSQALGERALVVYLINGQPLPTAHGYPARLLVPGLYGMKNGKWVTDLEVGAGGYQGYWEQQGWSREAMVKTMARIDVPANGDLLPLRPTFIAGVAFAGDRGIGEVDVSTDGGRTWTAAALKRPLDDLTWVLWELPWTPSSGTYVLAARAIDLSGRVQTPVEAAPLPDGASGYDAITVTAH